MRRLLFWLWSLPWPPALRRLVEPLAMQEWVQLFVVPHFRVGVVGLIRNDRGEFLLFRHTYRREYPWGLPTGFLEHDEQPAAALRREIFEEAGLVAEITSIWRVYADVRGIINLAFQGKANDGEFRPSTEISAAGFFPLGELPALIPDQLKLVRECQQEGIHHAHSA